MMRHKISQNVRLLIFTLIIFPFIACTLWPRISTALVAATPTFAPPTPTTLPASPTPRSATPTATSPPTEPAPPGFNFDDLTPYYQAMLPQFVTDVDSVAQAGASRYHLQVQLNLLPPSTLGNPQLTGQAQVRYTNTETTPLSEIYFNLYPNLPGYDGQMAVQAVRVDGRNVEPEFTQAQTALRVPLAQTLTPGSVVDLSLTYSATIPIQTDEGYNIFSASDNTLALAGFYPAIAAYDQTGWNIEIPPPYGDATYLDVALYQVELTVPQEMIVAASGTLLASQPNSDGTKTLTLASGPMRDFYIAARNDYAVITDTVNGILVSSYYRPGMADGGKLALRYAVDSLKVYNQAFGPYPYAEFDIVATPTTAGGVEYPGIVVIAQNLYGQAGGFFEHATAHEVAHQWWYGMVGNDQVDQPWLDESLTNYSTIFYWEATGGSKAAKKIIDDLFVGPYQYAQDQGQDRAVTGPVADFSVGEYGLFVYGKGPLFFNALRAEVGDETYLKIMQSYFAEYKYRIAQPDDLIRVIEQVSGRNVEPLIETWLQ